MPNYKMIDVLKNDTNAFDIYRLVEEWCFEHIPKERWRFDYSSTICVRGVDIPGRIIFRSKEDATAFRLKFPM